MEAIHIVLVWAFITATVEKLGYAAISKKVCGVYRSIVSPGEQKRLRGMRGKIVDVTRELRGTSAQDEFAKWARLRRQLDKLKAEYDTAAQSDTLTRTTSELKLTWILRALLWTSQVYLMATYRTRPMLQMPKEVLGPFAWLASFPFGALGSVSAFFWFFACKRLFKKVLE
ncbi:WRB/Get1 family [Fimicolochytrium jonesii]|uniref:WRB/Get1 family n=1 Tax=Fimicolochytrium jonesii TaxID=1396493 RepID=UPI0022FEC051|nr:WRB/Get1 family [Fimicolochytrium jonesii]KAI8823178.1 WRB/Get1 family [Fimicolochytrium jonesii]